MSPENLIRFTQTAIQTPSLTGMEQPFIQLVCEEMTRLGYDRVWVDAAGSAIGEIRGRHPGKSILLDAHADTVGVNPPDWTFDPFGGVIDQERIYGRGTADTKGNLAAMIHAAASLNRSKLAGNVYVSATVHEENFEGGSLKVVIDETQPDYVIIGEATGLNLNHGGRGRAEIVAETIGKSAHSSSPEVGLCAVHEMMRLMQAIDSHKLSSHPILGPASMVLTDIISAPYPGHSVLPNRCRVTYDRRLLTGETIESLENELCSFAAQANVACEFSLAETLETTYRNFPLQGKKFFPAWLIPSESLLVEQSLRGLRKLIPECQLGAYRFCTNAAYSAGIAGIPTVGFGLGRETDAHTADESITIRDLLLAAEGYQAIVEEVLAQKKR